MMLPVPRLVFLELPEYATSLLPDSFPSAWLQGNILYRFPKLQKTATDWLGRKVVQTSAQPGRAFFRENKWPFR